MRIDIHLNGNSEYKEFCIVCKKEAVFTQVEEGFRCSSCTSVNPRRIIIDPKLQWSLDPDGEYLHKSAGLFIVNAEQKILVIRRRLFPIGLSLPAGHIEASESPIQAARREAKEEVGLELGELDSLIEELRIENDSCRRGSDTHFWWIFGTRVADPTIISSEDEVAAVEWLSFAQLKSGTLLPAMDFIMLNYSSKLEAYIEKAVGN